ncbi:hypothetical protein J7L05_12215 [bacterium]|nr:hypothetical protein [bacterium]
MRLNSLWKIGYAKSTDNGATWPSPEIVHSTSEEILKDYVGIALTSTGTIYITYAEGNCFYMIRSTDTGRKRRVFN